MAQTSGEKPYESSILVMGTLGRVQLWGLPEARAAKVAEEIFSVWRDIDRTMSLYKPSSDLVMLNSRAGMGPVPVSSDIVEILTLSEGYRKKTEGIFDVRVGQLMDIWGLGVVRREKLPTSNEISATARRARNGSIRAYPEKKQAEIMDAGVKIDLGGIAKGYALDQACVVLPKRGVQRAILDLGGQLMMFHPPEEGWVVGLREPGNNQRVVGTVCVTQSCSIATSSQAERFRKHGKEKIGHVLDPRSGMPAQNSVSATVIAVSATEADALSTAFVIASHEEIPGLLRRFQGVELLRLVPDIHNQWQSEFETPAMKKIFIGTTKACRPGGFDAPY